MKNYGKVNCKVEMGGTIPFYHKENKIISFEASAAMWNSLIANCEYFKPLLTEHLSVGDKGVFQVLYPEKRKFFLNNYLVGGGFEPEPDENGECPYVMWEPVEIAPTSESEAGAEEENTAGTADNNLGVIKDIAKDYPYRKFYKPDSEEPQDFVDFEDELKGRIATWTNANYEAQAQPNDLNKITQRIENIRGIIPWLKPLKKFEVPPSFKELPKLGYVYQSRVQDGLMYCVESDNFLSENTPFWIQLKRPISGPTTWEFETVIIISLGISSSVSSSEPESPGETGTESEGGSSSEGLAQEYDLILRPNARPELIDYWWGRNGDGRDTSESPGEDSEVDLDVPETNRITFDTDVAKTLTENESIEIGFMTVHGKLVIFINGVPLIYTRTSPTDGKVVEAKIAADKIRVYGTNTQMAINASAMAFAPLAAFAIPAPALIDGNGKRYTNEDERRTGGDTARAAANAAAAEAAEAQALADEAQAIAAAAANAAAAAPFAREAAQAAAQVVAQAAAQAASLAAVAATRAAELAAAADAAEAEDDAADDAPGDYLTYKYMDAALSFHKSALAQLPADEEALYQPLWGVDCYVYQDFNGTSGTEGSGTDGFGFHGEGLVYFNRAGNADRNNGKAGLDYYVVAMTPDSPIAGENRPAPHGSYIVTNGGAPYFFRIRGGVDIEQETEEAWTDISSDVISITQDDSLDGDYTMLVKKADLTLYNKGGKYDYLRRKQVSFRVSWAWCDDTEQAITFTGVGVSSSIIESPGKEVINIHCEDPMWILKQIPIINSPMFDGMLAYAAIELLLRKAGFSDYDIDWDNKQHDFLPAGFNADDPRVRFDPYKTLYDCIKEISQRFQDHVYFDGSGKANLGRIEGGLFFDTGNLTPEMEFSRNPDNPDVTKVILDEKNVSHDLGSTVNVISIYSVNRENLDPILYTLTADAANLNPQPPADTLLIKKVYYQDQAAYGDNESMVEAAERLGERMFYPILTTSFSVVGFDGENILEPLAYVLVDGDSFRVTSVKRTYSADSNDYKTEVGCEWLFGTQP